MIEENGRNTEVGIMAMMDREKSPENEGQETMTRIGISHVEDRVKTEVRGEDRGENTQIMNKRAEVTGNTDLRKGRERPADGSITNTNERSQRSRSHDWTTLGAVRKWRLRRESWRMERSRKRRRWERKMETKIATMTMDVMTTGRNTRGKIVVSLIFH